MTDDNYLRTYYAYGEKLFLRPRAESSFRPKTNVENMYYLAWDTPDILW